MNTSPTLFVLLLLLGALYLPIIFFAMQRRDDGHGASIWLAASFALIAMVLNVAEAIEASKGSALPFQEIQIYVAFTLITILMLAFQTFMKHENWWISRCTLVQRHTDITA